MNRTYTNQTVVNPVSFFTGIEIENSPAKGLYTLFVVGFQDPVDVVIEANQLGILHIYLGANTSFAPSNTDEFLKWEWLACSLLEKGFLVTLDYDIKYQHYLLESQLIESAKFIPMISIKLPYTDLMPYNTTIKIDDSGFNKTNPGVWCHSLHDLKSRASFTPWHEYGNDSVVK